MRQYSIEPGTRKYVKGYGFLSFERKYKNQLLETGQDAINTASKEVVHKAGEFIRNKIADSVFKSNDVNTEKQEEIVEEIIIPP